MGGWFLFGLEKDMYNDQQWMRSGWPVLAVQMAQSRAIRCGSGDYQEWRQCQCASYLRDMTSKDGRKRQGKDTWTYILLNYAKLCNYYLCVCQAKTGSDYVDCGQCQCDYLHEEITSIHQSTFRNHQWYCRCEAPLCHRRPSWMVILLTLELLLGDSTGYYTKQ